MLETSYQSGSAFYSKKIVAVKKTVLIPILLFPITNRIIFIIFNINHVKIRSER